MFSIIQQFKSVQASKTTTKLKKNNCVIDFRNVGTAYGSTATLNQHIVSFFYILKPGPKHDHNTVNRAVK